MRNGDIVVLDTWPLIARLEGLEPSRSMLDELLTGSDADIVMSVVNYTEVYYRLARARDRRFAEHIAAELRTTVLVRPVDERTTHAAARIKHRYYVALGDAFAAATAVLHDAPLWTGDEELLTSDRLWRVRDLRDERARGEHAVKQKRKPVGLRPGVSGAPTRDSLLEPVSPPANAG